MKPKVIWTTREWEAVARYFMEHGHDPAKHGFKTHLSSAQDAVLPPERRRSLVGIPRGLRNEVVNTINRLSLTARPEPIPQPSQKSSLEEFSTEDLLVEVARRVAKFLESKSESGPLPVDRGFHPTTKHDPRPQSEVRPAKIKVLIIGPRGPQQDRLRTAFPTLDLRFVLAEELPSLVMTRSADCREIILWTKFMNHAQQTVAQNTGINTWYANGMEEIEARLRSYG